MRPISGGSYFGGACIISSDKAAEARAAEARAAEARAAEARAAEARAAEAGIKVKAEYIPLSHRDMESLDQLNKKTSDG